MHIQTPFYLYMTEVSHLDSWIGFGVGTGCKKDIKMHSKCYVHGSINSLCFTQNSEYTMSWIQLLLKCILGLREE